MKFVLVVPVSEAAGWAAADSQALAEAHAGPAPAREGNRVNEMAQEEQPAPLIQTAGRQEK